MEIVLENNERKFSSEIFLLLVELLWYQNIISMNSYDHLELEQTRIKKETFVIDNIKCLYDYGGLNPMKARKKIYPRKRIK